MTSVGAGARGAFAFDVASRRVGDLGFRAALFRIACLVVMGAALAYADGPLWAGLPLSLAAVGCYLSATTNYYQNEGRTVPREPVARWALRLTLDRSGKMSPDIPGLIEFVSYVPLAGVGPWMMADASAGPRLVALAAALAWVGSCLNAIFVDPAFYNPARSAEPWQRLLAAIGDRCRTTILCPVAAAISLLVVLPAPWTDWERLLAGALCLSLAAVQLKIRECDRILAVSAFTSESREIGSRHVMAEAAHRLVGGRLDLVRIRLPGDEEDLRADLEQLVSDLACGYDEVLALETRIDRDIENIDDWPGVLYNHLNRFAGLHQIDFSFGSAPPALSRVDRTIAYQVLDNFSRNAERAGASEATFDLDASTEMVELHARDDGRPVTAVGWLREGGGLRRMERRLTATGPGSGVYLLSDGSKTPKHIVARWVPTPPPPESAE
jgi:hypothetical protein